MERITMVQPHDALISPSIHGGKSTAPRSGAICRFPARRRSALLALRRSSPAASVGQAARLPPHDRRVASPPRAQCFEPADLAALAQHPPGALASPKPASGCGPRSSRSNSPPICRRVASAMISVLGPASAWSRAARSMPPMTARSWAAPSPISHRPHGKPSGRCRQHRSPSRG